MLAANKNINHNLIYRKEVIFKMKIKILKKLLAALCAATMSMSAISSVGAVRYQNINSDFQSNLQGEGAAAETNQTIQGMLSDIRSLTNGIHTVTGGFMLTGGSYEDWINTLTSIENNLSSIHHDNLIIPDVKIITFSFLFLYLG